MLIRGHPKAARTCSGILRGCTVDASRHHWCYSPTREKHRRCRSWHAFSMRVATHVCTARNRKIQMPKICWRKFGDASQKHRGYISDASPMPRGCFGKDNLLRKVRVSRIFDDALAMHRRSFFKTKRREGIAKKSNACIEFLRSTRDVSRCQKQSHDVADASPKLR